METKKVPVSKRALVGRINRVLAKDGWCGRVLKFSRSHIEREHYGDIFVLDLERTQAFDTHVDLKTLALELGVLKAYEDYIEE